MEKEPLTGTLYKILACPVCKADLRYSKNNKKLVCKVCKAEFNIKDGMPVMLVKSHKKRK